MNAGITENLMSAIFAFGDALHMFMCRGTSAKAYSLIWRSVSLLVTHRESKAGSFTIQPQSALLSLNVLTLMSGTSLA
jgi:hypothetical protein